MEKFLHVDGEKIQVCTYGNKKNPPVVFGKGLGGGADKDSLIDILSKEYLVYAFSPRNCLKSSGFVTIDNIISDLERVIQLAKKETKKTPYAIGHSTLGYALAKICAEKKIVKKALLLAPLIDVSEQNSFLNPYLKYCIKKKKLPFRYLTSFYNQSFKSGYNINRQRFDDKNIFPFIESLYREKCTKKLLIPTLVLLTGFSCLRLPVNIKRYSREWENLGADVKTFPSMNHWFSGKYLSGVGDDFSYFRKNRIIQNFFT